MKKTMLMAAAVAPWASLIIVGTVQSILALLWVVFSKMGVYSIIAALFLLYAIWGIYYLKTHPVEV